MPVSVGNDLVVSMNLLNAEYGNLFSRLNKAICYSYNGNLVYVVSYAIAGDNVYSTLGCTTYATITSISSSTLVDSNSVTYTRYSAGDSIFTTVPTEAANHQITAQEILDITNPNNTNSATSGKVMTITENGTYNVVGFTSVVVNVGSE